MDLLHDMTEELTTNSVGMAVYLALATVIEVGLPMRPVSWRSRARGILYWLIWLPVSAAIVVALNAEWRTLGVHPIAQLPLDRLFGWMGPLGTIPATVLAAILADFFFYWGHRGQHAFTWRFHAVHHAIRDLSAVNSYHHVSEKFFTFFLILLPASLFPAVGLGEPVWLAGVLSLQPIYLHSPTELQFGPLRWIFADNRFHRIHHSCEPAHFGKNFGACTTLWDQLFGTAYFPKPDEWPAVGLADVDEPRTVREWWNLPFRYRPVGRPLAQSAD